MASPVWSQTSTAAPALCLGEQDGGGRPRARTSPGCRPLFPGHLSTSFALTPTAQPAATWKGRNLMLQPHAGTGRFGDVSSGQKR